MFFWNSLAFSVIQQMLVIWSLVPLTFLNPSWTSGSSQFMYYWSLAWRILNIPLLACEMSANCPVVWAFFHIAFLWDWNENWPFQCCGHCWVFQICWHIECSTFTASSFRIVIVYYNVTIFNICSVSLLWFSPLVSCHLYVGILGLSSISISFKSLWFLS